MTRKKIFYIILIVIITLLVIGGITALTFYLTKCKNCENGCEFNMGIIAKKCKCKGCKNGGLCDKYGSCQISPSTHPTPPTYPPPPIPLHPHDPNRTSDDPMFKAIEKYNEFIKQYNDFSNKHPVISWGLHLVCPKDKFEQKLLQWFKDNLKNIEDKDLWNKSRNEFITNICPGLKPIVNLFK